MTPNQQRKNARRKVYSLGIPFGLTGTTDMWISSLISGYVDILLDKWICGYPLMIRSLPSLTFKNDIEAVSCFFETLYLWRSYMTGWGN
jgi:hypothetical protein